MGVYHQGGVVPVQIWLGQQRNLGVKEVFWWRTYSPPVWLLDGNRMRVTDLMGMNTEDMIAKVRSSIGDACGGQAVGLVAPRSSIDLDVWSERTADGDLAFEKLWTYTRHVGLDDLDIPADGLWGTVQRVLGRRGLTVWKIEKICGDAGG